MGLSNAINAYVDCKDLFEKALDDATGIRACMGTHEAAINMRTRLHYFRTLDRGVNAQIYPQGHPKHGLSDYDEYVVQIRKDEDNQFWVYIQRRDANIHAVESLTVEDEAAE